MEDLPTVITIDDVVAGSIAERRPLPPVLTVDETAALLRISRGSAYAAVASGEIPSLRVGKRLLIPTAKLMQQLGAGRAGE